LLNGYEILNRYFDQLFSNNQSSCIWWGSWFYWWCEQGFAGLQRNMVRTAFSIRASVS
jgi:hypothetical protein